MNLVSSVCSTVPVTINEGSDGEFPSHRFADQQCDDTFEVLCRQNLQEEETGIPTSTPMPLTTPTILPVSDALYLTLEVFVAVATILLLLLVTVGLFLIRKEIELKTMG